MKRFRFTWKDGRTHEADGERQTEAFATLGYGNLINMRAAIEKVEDITPLSYAVISERERVLRESFALSHTAYADVLEGKEAQKPNDSLYMRHYLFWRQNANRPEDFIPLTQKYPRLKIFIQNKTPANESFVVLLESLNRGIVGWIKLRNK